MTHPDGITYSIKFSSFSIDFVIKIPESVEMTKKFYKPGSNFIFAVAEIWVRNCKYEYCIMDAVRPGNFFEDIKELRKRLTTSFDVARLEYFMPQGGWCEWMCGYWHRLNEDCSRKKDENIYKVLIELSVFESRSSQLAIYLYNGSATIEIGSRDLNKAACENFCDTFDVAYVLKRLDEINSDIFQRLKVATWGEC